MSLQAKYADLISAAQAHGVANLAVRDQDGVLYIDGEAPSGDIKDRLWQIYGQIDPDYRSGDLVLNVSVVGGVVETTPSLYTVQPGDSLSKIGAKLGKNWRDIYEANKDKIGNNPDYIQVGWVLNIP